MKELALKKRKEKEQLLKAEEEIVIKPLEPLPNQPETVVPENADDEEQSEEEIVLMKPVFVPKYSRQTLQDPLEDEDGEAAETERRQREAHSLLVDYVRMQSETMKKREAEALEATSGAFDPKSVDDTDDLDEAAEFQAWKLRELLRMKRDRTEREAREREQIELERIRNLTEEERKEIDREKQAAWEAKPKGEYKFLQKYYHKGAFFGDMEDEVVQRDYTAPTGDDQRAKEFLPEVMQVKNFGKRGRTKWTHLTNEDTTDYHTGWGHRANESNYRLVNRMAGMKGDLDRPSKQRKQ